MYGQNKSRAIQYNKLKSKRVNMYKIYLSDNIANTKSSKNSIYIHIVAHKVHETKLEVHII